MLTGVETQRLLSPLGNEASLKAEHHKEGEGGPLSLQRTACESSSGGCRPICVLAAELALGLDVQNYNLWILDGLIDRLRRLRKQKAVLNILRLTIKYIEGQW